ncbi:transcription factor GTE7 [Raphanus sativus]|uniref:Transcription factor GTE7 n=1 Tax=Raphanus sativus TaxID=3726 RepID=A0A6J0P300_RAPSA|nr:transcription factor GTE7 [Raphanus sativus]
MAPAVLATLNEPSFHGQCGAVFMRKFTKQSVAAENSNCPLPPPNPNPNFDSSKQFDDSSNYGGYATFNLAGYSSSQLRELKKRFTSELEQIRILRERIESGTFETRQTEVSAVRSAPAGETSDLVLKKQKPKKRCNPFPAEDTHPKRVSNPESEKALAAMLSSCGQMLVKLMKHKWAWVFNTPVDVVGLGLHDYHLIVKKPMDLGTVKLNLEKGFYVSPLDFATDVRLTFRNAMAYNPKGQDVYFMAEKLLDQFDVMFNPAFKKFEAQRVKLAGSSSSRFEPEVKQRLWSQTPTSVEANVRRGTEQISIAKKLDSVKPTQPTLSPPKVLEPPPRERTPSPSPTPPPPAAVVHPLQPVSEVEAIPDVSEVTKGRKGKLPKPKAKDPNKRLMTMEEKSKLGMNLQDLPPEKLGQLVQILRKRNGHLAQDGDEIELDIEAVDNETLWELDRFVTNYKKMASKIKRQGFIHNVSTPPPARNMLLEAEMGSAEKRTRKGDAGEEDVDIGEDIPIEDYPSVEIERDGTAVAAAAASSGSSSSGSSSSSSGSSSSDSGSGGSSSGSDSDADSVQSPFVEAKEAQ